MTRYFRLLDDVHIPRRWHLGEVHSATGGVVDGLFSGAPIDVAGPLWIPVTTAGRSLEFSLTSFAVPVATRSLATAIRSVATKDVQEIPVTIDGSDKYEVVHATRSLPCLDEKRSRFRKWTEQDDRPDRMGQYRMVTALHVRGDAIPPDAHFFRIDGWSIALIVSEAVRRAMTEAGCLGATFEEVT